MLCIDTFQLVTTRYIYSTRLTRHSMGGFLSQPNLRCFNLKPLYACVYMHCHVLLWLLVQRQLNYPWRSGLTINSMEYHYDDVIMSAIASQITSLTIVNSIVYSDADQRKHQSSASLAFVWGIHRGPVNSTHKWPVTRKMFPFDDVIMLRMVMGPLLLVQLKFWGG